MNIVKNLLLQNQTRGDNDEKNHGINSNGLWNSIRRSRH